MSEQVNISFVRMHFVRSELQQSWTSSFQFQGFQSTRFNHKREHGGANPGKADYNLDPVPKFLKRSVSFLKVPGAMIVSFKLETTISILLKKATSALKRHNHQLVIGNLLQTRKHQVIFVTPSKRY